MRWQALLGLVVGSLPLVELLRRLILRPAYRGAQALNSAAKDLVDFRADLADLLNAVLLGTVSDKAVERRLRALERTVAENVAILNAHSKTHDELIKALRRAGIVWREEHDPRKEPPT